MLDFVVAGLSANSVPYVEGLELQRAVHRSVVAHERPDTVLLLEHPAVYTAGKRTLSEERPVDDTPVIDVDRGGKITWHGPGQLVGYPILHLQEPVDVVGYVRSLEGILIEVLVEFGIDAVRVAGRSGVWVGPADHEDKIAAIGIRVAQGVTMHGFALNCSNSLEPYSRIIACGIRDAGVTTMSRVLGRTIDPSELIDPITAAFLRATSLNSVSTNPASLDTVRTNA
ncbi:MAG: lipoyl(octanoyl) transferase LipB [Cryobacterium sp.]|uniref:lipoyl(octanoyl) transferase LipB n=1 Tax=unclassified Cryobacterium TaxID=2649013 RepID=UPI0018C9723D|nr:MULTISPECIES: lipoyl(octanoyl) transferase LipB [unclassified Cryobacterium]MCY7403707.1 lipoyl(octanoyl) transferase LipB [Cryobacterium sp.]MEC5155871.1 lipoyl(octanoyl) transferase [Cryobacterium sp. CAN_C3]